MISRREDLKLVLTKGVETKSVPRWSDDYRVTGSSIHCVVIWPLSVTRTVVSSFLNKCVETKTIPRWSDDCEWEDLQFIESRSGLCRLPQQSSHPYYCYHVQLLSTRASQHATQKWGENIIVANQALTLTLTRYAIIWRVVRPLFNK